MPGKFASRAGSRSGQGEIKRIYVANPTFRFDGVLWNFENVPFLFNFFEGEEKKSVLTLIFPKSIDHS